MRKLGIETIEYILLVLAINSLHPEKYLILLHWVSKMAAPSEDEDWEERKRTKFEIR